jgi:hypothetical protein
VLDISRIKRMPCFVIAVFCHDALVTAIAQKLEKIIANGRVFMNCRIRILSA